MSCRDVTDGREAVVDLARHNFVHICNRVSEICNRMSEALGSSASVAFVEPAGTGASVGLHSRGLHAGEAARIDGVGSLRGLRPLII